MSISKPINKIAGLSAYLYSFVLKNNNNTIIIKKRISTFSLPNIKNDTFITIKKDPTTKISVKNKK